MRGLARRGAPAAVICVIAATACILLVLARCEGRGAPAAGGADADPVVVITSTGAWADIARSVGGDAVRVTSLTSASRDVRTFEATPRDHRLVRGADLVVVNGGGYDAFMDELVTAAGVLAPVVEALQMSGLRSTSGEHEHGPSSEPDLDGASEHQYVWYDLAAAGKVAEAVAEALGQVDPDRAVNYLANARAVVEGLVPLRQLASDVATRTRGVGAAVTNPVADHLLELTGLTVMSSASLAELEAQLADGAASVLVLDGQAAQDQAEVLRGAAESAGVPVVVMTETLPADLHYTQWMSANIAAISAAVGA